MGTIEMMAMIYFVRQISARCFRYGNNDYLKNIVDDDNIIKVEQNQGYRRWLDALTSNELLKLL